MGYCYGIVLMLYLGLCNGFGCNNTGFYGDNCTTPCPDNCLGQICDIENGTCVSCVAGYRGDVCDLECEKSKYGQNCSLSCGNCRDNATCHHINGTCLGGCKKGFMGNLCTEVCRETNYGENCRLSCASNCVNGTCNSVTGKCHRVIKTTSLESSTNGGAIAAGVVTTILICVLALLGFFYFRRYRRKQNSDWDVGVYQDPGKPNVEDDTIYLNPSTNNSQQHLYEGASTGRDDVQKDIKNKENRLSGTTNENEQCLYEESDGHYYVEPECNKNGNDKNVLAVETENEDDYVEPDTHTNLNNTADKIEKGTLVAETEYEQCEYENYSFQAETAETQDSNDDKEMGSYNDQDEAPKDTCNKDLEDVRESYYGNIDPQEQLDESSNLQTLNETSNEDDEPSTEYANFE